MKIETLSIRSPFMRGLRRVPFKAVLPNRIELSSPKEPLTWDACRKSNRGLGFELQVFRLSSGFIGFRGLGFRVYGFRVYGFRG